MISMVPIVAALAARWYFGLRVLAQEGGRPCRRDSRKLPDSTVAKLPDEECAARFGEELRTQAMVEWKTSDPKAAESRQGTKRFGMAVPPLSAIVAIFAVAVAKIPLAAALAIFLVAIAISCALSISSLPAELAAITRTAKRLRESRAFPRRDDEDAVIRCANARAWNETLPPMLSSLQR